MTNHSNKEIRSELDRMLSGDLYHASDKELTARALKGRLLMEKYNQTSMVDREERAEILEEMLGSVGEGCWIETPIYFDYGSNTKIGKNFYANHGCTLLDVAPITIGDNVMFAPNVSLYTAGHPIDSAVRQSGLEFGKAITIGNGCWIGGGAIINPGITVGDNAIVASGAVVTKDVPENVIVAGNPARVLREINADDKAYWEALQAEYHASKELEQAE
ncbi:sugar O-acetyltransferase [Fundicoccus culcitae]|uniref:Acetyltransferase n=1 Tax=Fundicoccus culcitae TaxID=2969821 RepID=A0ABY5P5P0_9LACT|nr:sugar O-acetyltransferase [Fundicoccus culcitae]UUX33690.1 sugar O-acetyltransferase [Fundicoccus culcitae]